MREQIERLTWQNEEIEENIENVESTIKDKIAHLAYQEAKIVELENNKEKLQVAEKRLEILKKAAKPISDKLLLADLLWLSLHAEMETMKNVLENISTAHYEDENKQCARNLVCKSSQNYAKQYTLIDCITFSSKFLRDYLHTQRRTMLLKNLRKG